MRIKVVPRKRPLAALFFVGGNMELESKRLYYRPLKQEDACDLYEIYSQQEAVRWLSVPRHIDVEETLEGIRACELECRTSHQPMPFVLIEKRFEKLIGTIDFHHLSSPHSMEIGYLLHPSYWHLGLMSEALTCILDYGFEKMDLHRINAVCALQNTASIALLEKKGFHREGTYPKTMLLGDGRYHVMLLFSLMREEWRNPYEERIGS